MASRLSRLFRGRTQPRWRCFQMCALSWLRLRFAPVVALPTLRATGNLPSAPTCHIRRTPEHCRKSDPASGCHCAIAPQPTRVPGLELRWQRRCRQRPGRKPAVTPRRPGLSRLGLTTILPFSKDLLAVAGFRLRAETRPASLPDPRYQSCNRDPLPIPV